MRDRVWVGELFVQGQIPTHIHVYLVRVWAEGFESLEAE